MGTNVWLVVLWTGRVSRGVGGGIMGAVTLQVELKWYVIE